MKALIHQRVGRPSAGVQNHEACLSSTTAAAIAAAQQAGQQAAQQATAAKAAKTACRSNRASKEKEK